RVLPGAAVGLVGVGRLALLGQVVELLLALVQYLLLGVVEVLGGLFGVDVDVEGLVSGAAWLGLDLVPAQAPPAARRRQRQRRQEGQSVPHGICLLNGCGARVGPGGCACSTKPAARSRRLAPAAANAAPQVSGGAPAGG